MSESDKLEERQEGEHGESGTYADPYVPESSKDIYTTPEVVETAVVVEETEPAAVVTDTHGLFSGNQANSQPPYGNQPAGNGYGAQSPYGNQPTGGYGVQPPYGTQSSYGSQQVSGGYEVQPPYGAQASYGNQPTGGSYGAQSSYENQPSYGNQPAGGGYGAQPPYGTQASYENQQAGGSYEPQSSYGTQLPYGNQQTGGSYGTQASYGNQPAGGDYGAQPPYGTQSPYGNQASYGNQQTGGSYSGQSPYGNQQAGGGYGGQPPFGGQPPYDNPYSPYAAPQKKQNTGLIIGIVVGIILLFLVAVFALASKAVNLLSEKEKEELRRDVYDFDDDYEYHDDHDDFDYDYDDDFGYEYEYDYDYDDYFDDDDLYGDDYYESEEYDDRYYNLHNEIRSDLSYQVELEDYAYESDYENAVIVASIPVISGEDVPNLDKINADIRKEVDEITELFETEYESHIKESEDNYFMASLVGYVAYMDEDKLSIAWQEEMYSDRDGGVYLRSINVDMKNGVILDNNDILAVDDAFSVEFRTKSDEQNGEIDYLTYMTDQQITDYFKSDDIIVFYTPKGMEIGFNYEEGWVTATYEEYEQYLKVF